MGNRTRNRRKKKPILTPNQPLVKYGVLSFNSIGYGNPTINQHLAMGNTGILDNLLPDLYTHQFPSNESDETLSELKYIKTKLGRLKTRETYEECVAIDVDLSRYIEEISKRLGIEGVSDLIADVNESFLESLVTKTKFHFNRARPSQLSFYFVNQEELNPLKSCSSMSPSYPSGHALEALVIGDILIHHFPAQKDVLETLQRRVCISRIIIGAHYPSDNEFSRHIAEKIKQSPLIEEKYYTKEWDSLMTEINRDVPE